MSVASTNPARRGPARTVAILSAVLVLAWLAGAPAAARAPQAAKPYRILVTDDDGVRAPGIIALAQALEAVGEVTVIAPLDNQSAVGHGLTLSEPIYEDTVPMGNGRSATGLSATPASCVCVALAQLMKEPPDLVVSGVNRGSNFGLNAYVSGTVAAAREAAMHGIPAIASALDISGHPNYGPAAEATARVAEIVKRGGLPRGVFLNVNVPAGPADALKGLRLARQSQQMGTETYEEARTPYGRRYLWSVFHQPTQAEPGSDVQATLDGYVAVTPLKASEFDEEAMKTLRGRFGESKDR